VGRSLLQPWTRRCRARTSRIESGQRLHTILQPGGAGPSPHLHELDTLRRHCISLSGRRGFLQNAGTSPGACGLEKYYPAADRRFADRPV
jgi:hypothetical protein